MYSPTEAGGLKTKQQLLLIQWEMSVLNTVYFNIDLRLATNLVKDRGVFSIA